MNITIIGAGHVGLVTGTCFADLGHKVVCVDNDEGKVNKLKNKIMPIYEPGLEELVIRNLEEGRLSFTTSIEEGVESSEVIFIAVGTPPKENGEADLSAVEFVTRTIAENMKSYKLVVEKSTVPVQTGEWIKRTMNYHNHLGIDYDVASNPEFLREGTAINDFLNPDRIVIGVETERAKNILLELYKSFKAPIIVTDIQTAELIKHASNAFLAMKISFINAIANICERVRADVVKIAEGIGYDKRIGHAFLNAGVGFGGFCLPKDLSAFIRIAEKVGYDFELLKVVEKINNEQRRLLLKKIEDALWNLKGKTIAILGLAFKPGTDDLRYAPSIDIINSLLNQGVTIRAYDPVAREKAKSIFKDKEIIFCESPYEATKGSDAMVILTEWNEFKELDLSKIKKLLKTPIIIDGRNIYEPKKVAELGFIYSCIGRK